MSWKFVTCAIAVMVMVCAAEDATNPLIITQLWIPQDTKGLLTNPLKICYTAADGTYKGPAHLTGTDMHGNEGVVLQVQTADDPDPGLCFTFDDADIASLPNIKIQLILIATKSDPSGKDGLGIADITFPQVLPQAITVDVIGKTQDNKVIRLNQELVGNVLTINDVDKTCSNTPCYFMDGTKNPTFGSCAPDIGTNAENAEPVEFCGDVIPNTVDTEESEIQGSGIQEITLDHNNAGNKISLTSLCSQTKCTKAELVVQKVATRTEYPLVCPELEQSGGLDGDCELGEPIEEGKFYKVFIAYTDGTSALSFDQTTIKNRNLVGRKLTKGVIEAAWSIDKATSIHFQIKRNPEENGFAIADVDCSHMDTLCYSYFTGLTGDEFDLNLGVINNWADVIVGPDVAATTDPEHENSDTISGVSSKATSTSHTKGIDVEIFHLELDSTSMKAFAHTCFNIMQETSCQTCRYEAILIDREGHWTKSKITPMQENQLYCFTLPLEMSNEKNLLDMVLVYRNVSSGEALAAGSKIIDYSDLRITQPEMDDSSEGYTGTLAIVGAAIGGVACLIALVAVAVLFVMKRKRNNDGLQYPLHRSNVENSNIVHGLDNLNSTN